MLFRPSQFSPSCLPRRISLTTTSVHDVAAASSATGYILRGRHVLDSGTLERGTGHSTGAVHGLQTCCGSRVFGGIVRHAGYVLDDAAVGATFDVAIAADGGSGVGGLVGGGMAGGVGGWVVACRSVGGCVAENCAVFGVRVVDWDGCFVVTVVVRCGSCGGGCCAVVGVVFLVGGVVFVLACVLVLAALEDTFQDRWLLLLV